MSELSTARSDGGRRVDGLEADQLIIKVLWGRTDHTSSNLFWGVRVIATANWSSLGQVDRKEPSTYGGRSEKGH